MQATTLLDVMNEQVTSESCGYQRTTRAQTVSRMVVMSAIFGAKAWPAPATS
jgi:hypothetical protein